MTGVRGHEGYDEEPKIAVIADDLTGAAASAACLAHHLGRPVPVLTYREAMPPGPLVVNTETREKPHPGRVGEVVKRLWQRGYRRLDKRVDSTLRGSILEELREVRDAIGARVPLVAVTAYPRAGRHTVDGTQRWESASPPHLLGVVGEVVFGEEPHDLVRVRGQSPEDIWDRIVGAARGVGQVVVDASTEDELSRVGMALSRWDTDQCGPLVTVSSGALLRFYPIRPRRPAVVLLGSQTETVRVQAAHVMMSGWASVNAVSEDPELPTRPWLLWRGDSTPRTPGRASEELAGLAVSRLQDLAAWGWRPDNIILVGGETAQAFMQAAGAQALDVYGTPFPLVARGKVRGGLFDGTLVWTKGGLVGGPELLWEILSGCG